MTMWRVATLPSSFRAIPNAHAIISRGRRIARFFGLDWIAVQIVRTASSRDLSELVADLGGRLLRAEARDGPAARAAGA